MTAKIDGTNGVLQQYDYQVSTTGFSYTFAAGTTVLVMNPAGTLATGTITMPAAPADGMTISFSSTQAITALTVSANTGQSIVGNPTTLNAGGAASFVYRLANTTWYAQTNTAQVGSAGSPAPVLNVFTSTGTYTKPAAVKSIKVTVVGGGGNGGGVPTNPAGASAAGGGGGGTSIFIYPAPSLPASAIPYTVGAAAASSSFGAAPLTVITATGGATSASAVSGVAGSGGIGSGGTLNIGGGGGGTGVNTGFGGNGGSSMFGGGGAASQGATNGNAGQVYGGGGGGASKAANVATFSGGAGAQGVVLVEEFY